MYLASVLLYHICQYAITVYLLAVKLAMSSHANKIFARNMETDMNTFSLNIALDGKFVMLLEEEH